MTFGLWSSFQDCLDDVMARQGCDEPKARAAATAIKASFDAQGSIDEIVAKARGFRADAAPPAGRRTMTLSLDPLGIDRYTRSVRVVASTPDPVPGQKAVTSWDLSRFMKNPVVLWAHDSTCLPIGVATDVDPADPAGLAMRIRFASEKVSEVAEQVWNGLLEGVVKAVSVGFDQGEDGKATLVELSVVPVGLDEDAGTDAVNPGATEMTDDELAGRAKEAASILARHLGRVRKQRALLSGKAGEAAGAIGGEARAKKELRADFADGEVLRMDVAPFRMDALEDTPSGGKKLRARLSRVGVLMYRDESRPDGWRRELRLPSEVFKVDSLRTLEGAPLIDIKDHTGMITPETWQKVSLGHVHSVRQDGEYVESEIHVNDRDMLAAIERGDRRDISSGYKCRLSMREGSWRGQRFDCVQTDIVYNHAAMCPPNGGRAGPEVGVRVDSNSPQWGVSHWEAEDKIMKIRFDGREMDYGSKEHLDAIDAASAAAVAALKAEHAKVLAAATTEVQAKLDALKGERDGAVQSLESFKADKASEETKAKEKMEKKAKEQAEIARARRKLERDAFRLLSRVKSSDDEEEDGDDDAPDSDDGKGGKPFGKKAKEKKAKKLDAFFDSATDREIQEKVISSMPGGEKFDAKDRPDTYVQARYDMLIENLGETLGNGLADVVKAVHVHQERVDAGESFGGMSAMKAARAARDKQAAEAGKAPMFNGQGQGGK